MLFTLYDSIFSQFYHFNIEICDFMIFNTLPLEMSFNHEIWIIALEEITKFDPVNMRILF